MFKEGDSLIRQKMNSCFFEKNLRQNMRDGKRVFVKDLFQIQQNEPRFL